VAINVLSRMLYAKVGFESDQVSAFYFFHICLHDYILKPRSGGLIFLPIFGHGIYYSLESWLGKV
jgi:hypothetical protein